MAATSPHPTGRSKGMSLVARIIVIGLIGLIGALGAGVLSTINQSRSNASLQQSARVVQAAIATSIIHQRAAEARGAQLAYAWYTADSNGPLTDATEDVKRSPRPSMG